VPLTHRPARTRPHLVALDAFAALTVTAVYLGFVADRGADGAPVFEGPVWLGWVVAGAVGLPLAVRRYRPLTVLAVVLAASAAASLLDITREPHTATALALYLVALTRSPRVSTTAAALVLAVSGTAVVIGQAVLTPAGSVSEAVGIAALVWLFAGTGWSAGVTVRARRSRAAREELWRAERALVEERLRIARELHDVVSHGLGVIVVRASVAAHVAEARPEEAGAALRDIERSGREALTEMRRTLGALRQDTEPASLDPAPGLDDLSNLVARAEAAGVSVGLRVRRGRGLDTGTALTVYRIVQEAVTNVVRHTGAGARCEVEVDVGGDGGVCVRVVDDGGGAARAAGPVGTGGGHGLVGMRERVALFGGHVRAEPLPSGGFAVAVHLPGHHAPADPGPAGPSGSELTERSEHRERA
jgi:signal transduction histidine kinase